MYSSEYKVGDKVWFVASVSSPFKLYKEIPCVGGLIGKQDLEISYKFSPIPICGEIKSIYVNNRTYYVANDKIIETGGSRVSGPKGSHALHNTVDELQYEVQVCIPPSIYRTATDDYFSRFIDDYPSLSPCNTDLFFISGIVSVDEWFVADTPEKAELCYAEWKADKWKGQMTRLYWLPPEKMDDAIVECFREGLLCGETLKELHNQKTYTPFHNTLINIKNTMYGKTLFEYKYASYKRIP